MSHRSQLFLRPSRSSPSRARTPRRARSTCSTGTVADIQAAVASGALTYERLVQLYLNRIDAYDKKGPRLNAVLAINPRALETARALDAERKAKGLRSPLHGIPMAVKDNVDVSDMPSAAGTLALAGSRRRGAMRPSSAGCAKPARSSS